MKKILFVSHTMRGGGVEKVLANLLNKIDYTQNEVTLLLLRKEGVFLQQVPDAVTLKYLATGNDYYRGPVLFKTVRKAFRQLKFKVFFHAPFLIRHLILRETFDTEVVFIEDLAPLWRRIQRKNNKTVGWVHTMPHRINEDEKRTSKIAALSDFNHVVFVSRQVQIACTELVPSLKAKNTVINNPVDKEQVLCLANEHIDWPYAVPVFISVGRLSSLKGFISLANVHRRLLDEGMAHSVVVVGEGQERTELQQHLQQLALQHSFILQGFEKNPYAFIKRSDFFILNSITEGFGIVVAEAKILGKPIIATEVGGITDIVKNGETALLIPPSDETALYEAMKRMLSSPELAEKLARNCEQESLIYDESLLYEKMLAVL